MEKRNKIIYWVATALVSFGMLGSGLQQVFQTEAMAELLQPLGYPAYFMSIIGVWKVLAVITILIPGFILLKEWAYAGLFFVMTGAFVSHLAVGDGITELVGPFMQTVFIVLSWHFRSADRKISSAN
jgi:DoxX-like family